MFKSLAIRFFGMRKAGWANIYQRSDGSKMTGGMLYKTKEDAVSKGLCNGAASKYLGTKKLYF